MSNLWENEIAAIRSFGNDIRERGNISDITYCKEGTDEHIMLMLTDKNCVDIKTILMKYPEFLSSPASAKYHGAYPGGLFEHSVAVFLCAKELQSVFKVDHVDPIACIFHDLCKVGSYGFNDKDNKYFYKDNLGLPHGSESLRRIMKCGVQLSSEAWEFAVAYHMGAFNANNEETINFGKMCEKYPEVLLLHTADMMASKLMSL